MAGVAPELEAQGFFPIALRVENTARPLVETIRMTLSQYASQSNRDATARIDGMPESIWEQMKRLHFEVGGLAATPVLLFDQFEEVFTLEHKLSSRNAFLSQLADLCNESTPESIHELLIQNAQGKGAEMMSPESMQWWDRQPELRIVLSIRSDFLHKMDEISTIIPGILRNRYQLQPLNREQASEAILTPAASPGIFASPVFRYAPAATNTILDFLSGRAASTEARTADNEGLLKRQDEIEAFNLQIICQNIEESIIRQYQPENFEVTPAFFGDRAGLESEIKDFYSRQIQNLPDLYAQKTHTAVKDAEGLKLTAKKLIEEDLITPSGRRNSVVLETLLDRWGVSQDFLDILVESRLLRKELRLDSYYFEISHDTLLPAALASRNSRRAEEKEEMERARLTQELKEEAIKRQAMEDQLRVARRQRSLALRVSILSGGTLLLCAIVGVLFFYFWANSVQAEFQAAEENCRKEQFDAATEGYRILSQNRSKNWLLGGKIAKKGTDAQRFKIIFDNISRQMSLGDSLVFLEVNADYKGALNAYHKANDLVQQYQLINYSWTKGDSTYWRVDSMRINERKQDLKLRISSTRKTLITQFIICEREAEAFKEAGIWGQQKRNLKEMERLLPDNKADTEALRHALNMKSTTPSEYVKKELMDCEFRLK